MLASSRADFEKVGRIFILQGICFREHSPLISPLKKLKVILKDFCTGDCFFSFYQSKHVMQEKQETLLDTINKLKSDVDKAKEKSAQQKAHIRDLQQVWFCSFICSPFFFFSFFFVVFNRSFVRPFVCSLVSMFVCRSFVCFCSLFLFISYLPC